MDLIAFVEARLAEDEATARAAGDGRWRVDHWISASSTCPDRCSCRRIESVDFTIYDEGGHDEAQAAHVARHDPARVLREVAAKRQLLERYTRATAALPSLVSSYLRGEDSGYAEACEDVLRDLASVWSDHPDYDPTWSPT